MEKDVDRTIWRRIGLILIVLPVCFFFPFALLLVGFLAWTIYEDLKSQGELNAPPPLSWKNVGPDNDNWLAFFRERCESPAEEKFLRAIVEEFDLKPSDGFLKSSGLLLDMQVKVGNYRFDFLANGRLVIEVDGATYHSRPEQLERDRIRDEYSVRKGYQVLRIPASVVFNMPEEAMRRVRAALAELQNHKHTEGVKPALKQEAAAQPRKTFSEKLDDFSRTVTVWHEVDKATADFKLAMSVERSHLERLVELSELEQSVEEMSPEKRKHFDEARLLFGGDDEAPTLAFEWRDIVKPVPVEDAEIQHKIEAAWEFAAEARNASLAQLRARCAEDPVFKTILCRKLVEAGCPLRVGFRIVPNVLCFPSKSTIDWDALLVPGEKDGSSRMK